jgi:hypothetical protein
MKLALARQKAGVDPTVNRTSCLITLFFCPNWSCLLFSVDCVKTGGSEAEIVFTCKVPTDLPVNTTW